MEPTHTSTAKKRVNLTIPESLLEEAKGLGVNLSGGATAGIAAAVKKAKEEEWLKENWDAIQAYNREVQERGLLIKPLWLQDQG